MRHRAAPAHLRYGRAAFRSRCRAVALLVLGIGVASACQAGGSPGPAASTATLRPPASGQTDAPTPDPGGGAAPSSSPPEVPILDDDAFRDASATRCTDARPSGVDVFAGPPLPAAKFPGYDGVHIVVVEMLDANGAGGPPPPLPAGEAYYPASTSLVAVEGSTEALPIEARAASEVRLLACIVLRAGRSASYSGESGEVTVTALDAVVWMVDWATGAWVGDPWVTTAELGTFINLANILGVDGASFLPADVRPSIAYFAGQAVPLSGAYHGGAGGYVVAEFDVPADLPAGTRLLPGYTFVVRLVVLGDRGGAIDFIDVLCAPARVVGETPLRVATDVPHQVGRFAARSADVEIDGDFRSEWLVVGQIRGISARAADCGIPRSTDWQAALALRAERDGGGYVLIP